MAILEQTISIYETAHVYS